MPASLSLAPLLLREGAAYAHTLRGAEAEAVEDLPDLAVAGAVQQEMLVTGTDGKDVTSKSWSKSCLSTGQQRTKTNGSESRTAATGTSALFLKPQEFR